MDVAVKFLTECIAATAKRRVICVLATIEGINFRGVQFAVLRVRTVMAALGQGNDPDKFV